MQFTSQVTAVLADVVEAVVPLLSVTFAVKSDCVLMPTELEVGVMEIAVMVATPVLPPPHEGSTTIAAIITAVMAQIEAAEAHALRQENFSSGFNFMSGFAVVPTDIIA
jgi:hypothetical protein